MNNTLTKNKTLEAISLALRNPFPPSVLKYRVGATTKSDDKAIPLFYLTARDIYTRLDQVLGWENWKKDTELIKDTEGRVIAAHTILFIWTGDTWVSRDDYGTPTKTEGIKGAVSDSVKRAAVALGIGRYLYYIPNTWEPIDAQKHFVSDPRKSLAPQFLPNAKVQDWEAFAAEQNYDGEIDLESADLSPEEKDILQKSAEIKAKLLAKKGA